MNIYKTELEKEYYILTPINVCGYITKNDGKLHFKDGLNIETFLNEDDFKKRCDELNIIL